MPWKNKTPLKTIYGTQVFKMSFIVKFASIYINKQTNSCPVRKSFRLSLLGIGYGFNKLNMLHSEEQRHWHQEKTTKKPHSRKFNVHYISNQNDSYLLHKYIYIEKKKKQNTKTSHLSWIFRMNFSKAYLNSLSVLPLYMAPVPIPSKPTGRQRDVCKTNPK